MLVEAVLRDFERLGVDAYLLQQLGLCRGLLRMGHEEIQQRELVVSRYAVIDRLDSGRFICTNTGVKMYLFGTLINSVGFLSRKSVSSLTQGFTPVTWLVIASQVANGLLYAAILKARPRAWLDIFLTRRYSVL